MARAGTLVLGCGPQFAQAFLPPALIDFTAQAPRVEVKVAVESWGALTRMLRAGELDMFIADTDDIRGQADLQVNALPVSGGAMDCHPDHPLPSRGEVLPENLMEFPLATASLPSRVLQWLAHIKRRRW